MAFKFPVLSPKEDHLSDWVKERVASKQPISLDEWKGMRCNSWEQEALYPLLDNEALKHVAQHILNNCSPRKSRPCSVYDDSAMHVFIPLLISRVP